MERIRLLISVLMAAMWKIRPPRMALPRLIKFAQHPFVKKGHAKVLAGGSGLSFGSFAFGGLALVAVCLITAFVIATHTGTDPGHLLLAAGPTLLTRANELKAQRATVAAEAKAILTAAEAENRNMTAEERAKYDELKNKMAEFGQRAKDLEEQHADEAEYGTPESRSRPPVPPATDIPNEKKEWRSFGEFMHAIRFRKNDPRLADLYSDEVGRGATEEERALSMDVNESGGFAVPTQFKEGLLEVTPQEAIIEPRASVMEAGDPPDAAVEMIALDQGAGSNMYGGVEMQWIEEGGDKPETDAAIKLIRLQPHELAGTMVVTDKLLRNWQASGPLLQRQMRRAIIAAKEFAYLNGDGDGKPLGPINHPSSYEVARAGAGVTYADIVEMVARIKLGGKPVWVTSQAIIPSLATLVDPEGHYIFVPNARDGLGATLMGYPLLFNERSPALGEDGDLILADWEYYLIKPGSGPFVAASEHVLFRSNKTVIKAFTNVDGKPWLTDTITLENGYEVSPFVVLGDGIAS